MSITSHHFIDKFFSCISNEGALTLGSKILEYKQSENYKSQILQYSLWAIACACIAAVILFQKEAKNQSTQPSNRIQHCLSQKSMKPVSLNVHTEAVGH